MRQSSWPYSAKSSVSERGLSEVITGCERSSRHERARERVRSVVLSYLLDKVTKSDVETCPFRTKKCDSSTTTASILCRGSTAVRLLILLCRIQPPQTNAIQQLNCFNPVPWEYSATTVPHSAPPNEYTPPCERPHMHVSRCFVEIPIIYFVCQVPGMYQAYRQLAGK